VRIALPIVKATSGLTDNVNSTGLTVTKNTGTVASSATDIYILCAKGACSNWTWSGNAITGGKKSTACSNIPTGGAAC
jgi:polygalacturonase